MVRKNCATQIIPAVRYHGIACIYLILAEILLDLDHHTSKRYSGLTVDYGEYFKLTVNFHFD